MADDPKAKKPTRTLKEDLAIVGSMIFGNGLAGKAGKALKTRNTAIDSAVEDVEMARRHANQNTDSNNY